MKEVLRGLHADEFPPSFQEFMDLANGDPKAAVEKIRNMPFPIVQEIAMHARANGLSSVLRALGSKNIEKSDSLREV